MSHFVISESTHAAQYRVFPSTGLVMGFQYRGSLSMLTSGQETPLATAGITGISDRYQSFANSANTGTVLVYFTESGFAHFARNPVHELFNQSLALEALFDRYEVERLEEQLSNATNDVLRIQAVERFLMKQLRQNASDELVGEAVKRIYAAKGNVRIGKLSEQLYTSQSPLEKRFRKCVGTTPKKFASIVRFNALLNELNSEKSLTDLCYAYQFFDQAHFIKDFRKYTGTTPDEFRNK